MTGSQYLADVATGIGGLSHPAPGPRALYVELKRRFNGNNNGEIFLSHRDAAITLHVHRNTVEPWFKLIEERGFIQLTRAPQLGRWLRPARWMAAKHLWLSRNGESPHEYCACVVTFLVHRFALGNVVH